MLSYLNVVVLITYDCLIEELKHEGYHGPIWVNHILVSECNTFHFNFPMPFTTSLFLF